jgi:hypothetical protein
LTTSDRENGLAASLSQEPQAFVNLFHKLWVLRLRVPDWTSILPVLKKGTSMRVRFVPPVLRNKPALTEGVRGGTVQNRAVTGAAEDADGGVGKHGPIIESQGAIVAP